MVCNKHATCWDWVGYVTVVHMSTTDTPLLNEHLLKEGQKVGYARVSSHDQNLDRQLTELNDAGVKRIFEDKASGASIDARAGFQQLLRYVREGDTVVVTSPDRLARNTKELLDIADSLAQQEIGLSFLKHPELSTTSSSGRFMLTILSAVAEMERDLIRERQAEGIALAKKRGVYTQAKLNAEQIEQARQRVENGVPKTVVARDLKVDRKTLSRALSGTGVYANTDN